MGDKNMQVMSVRGIEVHYDPGSVKEVREGGSYTSIHLTNGSTLNLPNQEAGRKYKGISIWNAPGKSGQSVVNMQGIQGAVYSGSHTKPNEVYLTNCKNCFVDVQDGRVKDFVQVDSYDEDCKETNSIRVDMGDILGSDTSFQNYEKGAPKLGLFKR